MVREAVGRERTDGAGVLLDVRVERLDDGVGVSGLALLDRDLVGRVDGGCGEGAGDEGRDGEERELHFK